jgi:ribosomal protein S18 acetylase RimI-like enzyme
MMSSSIRRATHGDTPALLDLMQAAHAEAGFALDSVAAAAAFTTLLGDVSHGCAWIACRGVAAAGYIVITFKLSMESGGFDAFVEDLYVRPTARRCGMGTRLLSAAIAACSERGVSAMHVEVGSDNEGARMLYRKHGLEDRGRLILTAQLRDNRMARRE